MALSASERPGSTWFRGLERFMFVATRMGSLHRRSQTLCARVFQHGRHHLFAVGDISSSTKFEDDREKPLIFLSKSTALHSF